MVKEGRGYLTLQSISGLSVIKKKKAHFSHWAGGEAEEGLQEEGSTGLFQRPFKGLTAQVGRAGFVTSMIQSKSSDQLGKVSSK